jgi:phosphomannomutase
VRASNTGPVLVLRCEADSPARLAEIRADLEGQIKDITAQMQAKS